MLAPFQATLPRTQVSQDSFFQDLSQNVKGKQFNIEWKGDSGFYSPGRYTFFETNMPWKRHPLRYFMKPQLGETKLATAKHFAAVVAKESDFIASNCNVDRMLANLKTICDRMLRNTTASQKGQIKGHFDTAIGTLQGAQKRLLQAKQKEVLARREAQLQLRKNNEKKWIQGIETSPQIWQAVFRGEAILKRTILSPEIKTILAKRIAFWVKESEQSLRFMKVDTQPMIETLTNLRGRITKKVTPLQKKTIEQALNAAIGDLKAIGVQVRKDYDTTWTGWAKNRTVVPFKNTVLFPVLHPVRTTKGVARVAFGTVKFPFIVGGKTVRFGWKVMKLPCSVIHSAISRKK
ncbi:MAG: hypothetical protein KR126chlam3_01655 [Chlamydiae bacterium]|nr:hypothetical protein [Chlamydiota bacterium]